MIKALTLAIALAMLTTLAAAEPTPEYCRRTGVDVPDGAIVTGQIVQSSGGPWSYIRTLCTSGNYVAGCAIPLEDNKWHIVYSNDCVGQHERCHALYEREYHVQEKSIPRERWNLGCRRVNIYEQY